MEKQSKEQEDPQLQPPQRSELKSKRMRTPSTQSTGQGRGSASAICTPPSAAASISVEKVSIQIPNL
ncbi:hypothetical protein U9M48_012834 [Paspalum notatum var. saurae]|uniref:Uncharacterized protein n=1 Tax=Paspalum notatum var. saurae TaxID=547442 RepID=A0AAQ3SYC6_PASNO